MKLKVNPGRLSGQVTIPGSKSHTIRGLILGLLAGGESRLVRPLASSDTESCVEFCRALGAEVDTSDPACWKIRGTAGRPAPRRELVDVGNSGTTLFLGMGAAALCERLVEITGDEQTQRRSAAPLLHALEQLGATARSKAGTGCAPIVVGGGLKGGKASIECPTSQYLSSLLISCPLADRDTEIVVPLLHEKPYVRMTCRWLEEMNVRMEPSPDLQHFRIPGRQRYAAFEKAVPADFSSATFFLVAAAVTGCEVLLSGLDMDDTQGDKAVVGMLRAMGCEATVQRGGLRVKGPKVLRGGTFDLNATPDALPAMAVAACVAQGETRLVNVPQARIKETDRLSAMREELGRMGARVKELPDGLVVTGGALHGAAVDGRGDHRIVMALAVAGLRAEGETIVSTAERASVTFPEFVPLMQGLGAPMKLEKD